MANIIYHQLNVLCCCTFRCCIIFAGINNTIIKIFPPEFQITSLAKLNQGCEQLKGPWYTVSNYILQIPTRWHSPEALRGTSPSLQEGPPVPWFRKLLNWEKRCSFAWYKMSTIQVGLGRRAHLLGFTGVRGKSHVSVSCWCITKHSKR